jgi:hypothetical protein
VAPSFCDQTLATVRSAELSLTTTATLPCPLTAGINERIRKVRISPHLILLIIIKYWYINFISDFFKELPPGRGGQKMP